MTEQLELYAVVSQIFGAVCLFFLLRKNFSTAMKPLMTAYFALVASGILHLFAKTQTDLQTIVSSVFFFLAAIMFFVAARKISGGETE